MEFEKWQALGNDYLIVEAQVLEFELTPARIRAICAPHTGVFADGILLLPDGRPIRDKYVLSDTSVPLAGTVIGRDEIRGMVLRRTDGLVAIASRVSGIYPDGWTPVSEGSTRIKRPDVDD